MDSVQRVDQLIRHNIIKYTQIKNEEIYKRQLQAYEKQRKKEALKSYAEIVKQGNRKAIQKMKTKQKSKKSKKVKNKTNAIPVQQSLADNNGQNKKNKLNQSEIKRIQQAISERAEKLLQQKKLQALDQCLEKQKKKTKLHELNQRCRKLSKSNVKLVPSEKSAIPQKRRKILEQFQKKALLQIEQLDHIIGQIIGGQKSAKISKKTEFKSLKLQTSKNPEGLTDENMIDKIETKIFKNGQNVHSELTLYDLDNPIFIKSTQQLLSLKYIPL